MKSPDPDRLCNASDSALALAAQAGDLDAFEELVRRYHHPLICFLQFYSRDLHIAEDVAQESFLNCFRYIQTYCCDRPFKPWLYTIARRCLTKRRDANNMLLPLPELVADTQSSPSRNTEAAEQRRSLWQIVRQHTNDDEFQLIWHRYADCLPISRIALSRNESVAAIKMRLSRLRKRLRPCLEPLLHEFVSSPSLPLTQTRAA